jgi:hypothetical protein
LRQQTCDGGAGIIVDPSAKQGHTTMAAAAGRGEDGNGKGGGGDDNVNGRDGGSNGGRAATAAGTYNIQQSAKSGSNDASNDARTMPRWCQTSTCTGKARAMR